MSKVERIIHQDTCNSHHKHSWGKQPQFIFPLVPLQCALTLGNASLPHSACCLKCLRRASISILSSACRSRLTGRRPECWRLLAHCGYLSSSLHSSLGPISIIYTERPRSQNPDCPWNCWPPCSVPQNPSASAPVAFPAWQSLLPRAPVAEEPVGMNHLVQIV